MGRGGPGGIRSFVKSPILASPPHRGGGFCLVGGIGASPMTRRRGELRKYGEGSARAGSRGRSVIGRRPDATRRRGVKSEGLRVKGFLVGMVGGFGLLWGLRSWPHQPTDRCALVPPSSGRTGSFWFTSSVVFSIRLLTPASRPLKKGGDRGFAWWGGSAPLVGPSGIYFTPLVCYPFVASGLPR